MISLIRAPQRGRLGRATAFLVFSAACLVVHAADPAPAPDAPKTSPLQQGETCEFSAPTDQNAAATVTLNLAASRFSGEVPATGEFAIFSEAYLWWSGPLKVEHSGDRVVATGQVAARGMDMLLVADHAVASFPGGPNNVAAVTLSRDDFIKTLGHVLPPEGHAVFFNPAEIRPPPETPKPDASRADVEEYIASVRRWDADVQATLNGLNNDLVRARILWTDLHTAGRLPWTPEQIAELTKRYDNTDDLNAQITRQRDDARQQAQSFVESWNSAHPPGPNGTALELHF